jgi:glycosyltransferase involved in cell wall biosynthesis
LRSRTIARLARSCTTFPKFRDFTYPCSNLPPRQMAGYSPANLSRIMVGSQVRISELTKALRITTFHGPYPERLIAGLSRGLSLARWLLYFDHVSRCERRIVRLLRRKNQNWLLDVHDIPHLQEQYFGVPVSPRVKEEFQSFAKECDLLLFPSNSLAKMFEDSCKGDCSALNIVLPNAANPRRFTPTPMPERKVFSYIGGYAPSRGLERLVRSFQILRERCDDVWLWIATPSLLPAWIVREERVVTLTDISYDRDSPELFRQTYAFVIPHLKNPYMDAATPIKLFEAMACARPVISTNCYETSRIIETEACGIVVPEDERALAEAMHNLANDKATAEKMGSKGREAIEARHSWEHRALSLASALGARQ